jgi:transcriptional regulator GlxA family with amidase domain
MSENILDPMSYFLTGPKEMAPRLVGILGFDGVRTLDLTGPLEVFSAARVGNNRDRGQPCYKVILVGLTGKTFASESGIVFKAQRTIKSAPALDTIIVPGGAGLRNAEAIKSAAKWLAGRAGVTRRMACVSAGIYAMAPTGLLDGRCVTTHWRFTRDVAQRFPTLRIQYTASFLKDGPFYTCGGGNTGIEMTLALIDEDYGSQVALAVAREFGMNLRPPGDDEPMLDPATYQSGPTERLAELPAWILGHLRDKLSVEVLAERTSVCPRHFGRLFKRAFHRTPADFVEHLRLTEARRLLITPRNSIEGVAASVGFKSADVFRRSFERRFGVTPREFRDRFQFDVQDIATEPGTTQTAVIPYRRVRVHAD